MRTAAKQDSSKLPEGQISSRKSDFPKLNLRILTSGNRIIFLLFIEERILIEVLIYSMEIYTAILPRMM